MLQHVMTYKEELKIAFRKTWFNEHFKFYSNRSYFEDFEFESNTKCNHPFVVIDPQTNKVIGYISYNFHRDAGKVNSFSVINFMSDPKIELNPAERLRFSKIITSDLKSAIKNIMNHPDFKLIEFTAYIGNPALFKYLKIVKRRKGICSGILHKSVKLSDGYYYDHVQFQIFKDIEREIPEGLEYIRQVSDILIEKVILNQKVV